MNAEQRIADLRQAVLECLIIPNSKLPAYARNRKGRKLGPENFEPTSPDDQKTYRKLSEQFTSLAFADRKAESRLALQAVENFKAEIKATKAELVAKYRDDVSNDRPIQFARPNELLQNEAMMQFASEFKLFGESNGDEFTCDDCGQHHATCLCR